MAVCLSESLPGCLHGLLRLNLSVNGSSAKAITQIYRHRQALSKHMGPRASPRKLWIDSDAGVDDSQGILLALAANDVELVGISAVHGNTKVRQVAKNIARLLTLTGRPDIPIYEGAEKALTAEAVDGSFVQTLHHCMLDDAIDFLQYHGSDGFGDVPDAPPRSDNITLAPQKDSACDALVKAADQEGGALSIVAIGPLTNLALACQKDKNFHSKIKHLVVMGGTWGRGNVSPCAEFNFYADPEAARLVLSRFQDVHMVTWECSLRNAVPWNHVDQWLQVQSPIAEFMASVFGKSAAYDKEHSAEGYPLGYAACDPFAVAVALDPEIITQACQVHCDVEVQGELTRGQSVFDFNNNWDRRPNVHLIQSLDLARFQKQVLRSLTSMSTS